jgi:hypothetical protein
MIIIGVEHEDIKGQTTEHIIMMIDDELFEAGLDEVGSASIILSEPSLSLLMSERDEGTGRSKMAVIYDHFDKAGIPITRAARIDICGRLLK